jgi:tRNA dimethylallyltransferase
VSVARALVGPTASGKSETAVALAYDIGAEIVSVDSMLVYRGMDVGTAKPSAGERARVPHHLIDVAEPSERFTVARYQELAGRARVDVEGRERRVLYVGGSGLYFRAAVDKLAFPPEDRSTRAVLQAEADVAGASALHRRLSDLDPVAAARIDPENIRRTVRALEVAAVTGTPFSTFAEPWGRFDPEAIRVAGIRLARDVLAERVRRRVRAMLDAGWLDEVRALVTQGFGEWLTSTQAIGYAELAAHLEGRLTMEDAVQRTESRTKHLARRQMAWFVRDPRVRWFEAGPAGAVELLDDLRSYLESA